MSFDLGPLDKYSFDGAVILFELSCDTSTGALVGCRRLQERCYGIVRPLTLLSRAAGGNPWAEQVKAMPGRW